jgi:HEPN domain-containing protein
MPTTRTDLIRLSRAKLRDAEVLLRNRRYHGAVYLSGYAVEFALKARICRSLHWTEYPTQKEYDSFRTHDLERLLHLSGRSQSIRSSVSNTWAWSEVKQWKPEKRYEPLRTVTRKYAADMIANVRTVLALI